MNIFRTKRINNITRENEVQFVSNNERNALLFIVVVVYFAISVIVWGPSGLTRGFFQDDALLLGHSIYLSEPLRQLFTPSPIPTRLLVHVPFTLALWSGYPLAAAQILYLLIWFGMGLVAYLIAKTLVPTERLLPFVSGILVLTATPDYLTNSMVALHYNASVFCFFIAFYLILRFIQGGSIKFLMGSLIFLNGSIWTTDAAFAAIFLLPVLLWGINGFRLNHRLVFACIAWLVASSTYLFMFAQNYINSPGYLENALIPMTLNERIVRLTELVANNFTPWVWAFFRRNWFPPETSVIPTTTYVALSVLATLIYLAGVYFVTRKQHTETHENESQVLSVRIIWCTFTFLVITVCSNAIFTSVQFSEFFYRTHLMSRVWAALFIAFLLHELSSRIRMRSLTYLITAAFVFLGTYAAVDRQDYFMGYWKKHKQELISILSTIPELSKNSTLLLRVTEYEGYIATDVGYLAQSWLTIMHNDPSMFKRVILWSDKRGEDCRAEENGLFCWNNNYCDGKDINNCNGKLLPYSMIVVMKYFAEKNEYQLVSDLSDVTNVGQIDQTLKYAPNLQINEKNVSSSVRNIFNIKTENMAFHQ